jgi:hypothetical protein
MALNVMLSGSNVSRWATPADSPDATFDGNQPQGVLDTTGWTVAGSSPDRVLKDPHGQVYAREMNDNAGEASSGGSRPYINDTETGIVANRASGFQSPWETFDLLEPGVGYGAAVFTAADSDGLIWGTDIGPAQIVEISADATTWVAAYTLASAGTWVALVDTSAAQAADLVGKGLAYTLFTPRAIRFRCAIQDLNTGMLYAGGDDPSFVFDFTYTAS